MASGDVLRAAIPATSKLVTENNAGGYGTPKQQGVFAQNPLMTPKYARNKGERNAEFRESMARMYLSLADLSSEAQAYYLKTIPNDRRVKALAEVLALSKGGFIDFFLQQITESYNEAMQVDKVLGDNYVAFFFGQEPPVFQYAGTLLNSMQDDQRTGFALAYQHLIRGSQLAKRNALIRIRYDSVIVSGAMVSSNMTMNAENELAVPFQFGLLVKEVVWVNPWKGVKTDVKDYIELERSFAKEGVLSDVGRAQDVRVRTTMNMPAEDPFETEEKTKQEALEDEAQNVASAGVAVTEGDPGLNNQIAAASSGAVYGNVILDLLHPNFPAPIP